MSHVLSPPARGGVRRTAFRIGRSMLVRRVHLLLALAFWGTLLNAEGASFGGLVETLVLAGGWWLALEATALHEQNQLRSGAWTAIQLAGAATFYVIGVLALSTVVDLPVSNGHLVAGVIELTVIAYVWQVMVAAGLGLGRPLRCLVIGSPSSARLLLREPLAPGAQDFEIVGLIDDNPREGASQAAGELPLLGTLHELEHALEAADCDLVVIGARTGRPAVFQRLLALSHLSFNVVELPEFFEQKFGRVPVEEITSVWFLHALNVANRGISAALKRFLDLVVALLLLVLSAPLMLLTALAVKLTSPGAVFYSQQRVGEHGRVFTCVKFRSMRDDAETDGAVWADEDDPRTTRVGRYLRRYRIDELPQLWNVLRGEMTMVGPRPERPEFVRQLVEAVPFYSPRHLTKPGLTGWAQVSAGYAATLDDARLKLSYDLYYLKHRGLALDLAILLRTIGVVLRGTGAR
jgi:exopolysaccharide biosynthesis polyprenyl glycosylphosphotransferase